MITITTSLPPKELHPNNCCHWRVKARKTKEQRDRTAAEAKIQASRQNWRPVKAAIITLHFKFTSVNSQKHDPDNANAWAKASIDGIKDGGILHDDNKCTYLPPLQTIVKTAMEEQLEITVQDSTGCRLFVLTDEEVAEVEAAIPGFFTR